MSASALVINDLSKKFENIWAVRNLNLELQSGEIFVLLGPNGAGKTTTLKMIAGLLHPTKGQVLIEGIDVEKDPLRAKSIIGYVPDEPFIYGKLTGREFIHFIIGIYGVLPENIQQHISQLFDLLEIGGWIDDYSEGYSHGMKQKVIMCQLLLHDPHLILIDEPLVGLDPKSSRTVRRLFLELRAQRKALLISTHTLSFAQDIATRIGIINNGELKFIGSLKELAQISGKDDIEDIYLKLSEQD